MIVSEYSIREIVNTMPLVQLNKNTAVKPKFHWGDEMELNRYIQLNKENSYPLIWLLPSNDNYLGTRYENLIKDCSFVIATRETRKELFNDQRYIRSFDLVLNPLTKNLVYGLTHSNISEREGQDGFTSFKHPNYSADSESNGTIDIWDAVKLDIRIKFKDNIECLKPINYG